LRFSHLWLFTTQNTTTWIWIIYSQNFLRKTWTKCLICLQEMIAILTEKQFWKNRKSTTVNSTYQNVWQMDDTKPYSVTNLQVTWPSEAWTCRKFSVVLWAIECYLVVSLLPNGEKELTTLPLYLIIVLDSGLIPSCHFSIQHVLNLLFPDFPLTYLLIMSFILNPIYMSKSFVLMKGKQNWFNVLKFQDNDRH
jgi:hypothetical protein